MAKAIGDELATAVLRTKSLKAYMLDSTQLQAGRHVEDADHKPPLRDKDGQGAHTDGRQASPVHRV